jgi:hypothetical protein
LSHYDLSLPEAAHLLASALGTGVSTDEILVACQHWMVTRPNTPFTPKLTAEAAKEFMSTQQRVSERRRRSVQWYIDQFRNKFGKRLLHDILDREIKDFVDGRNWAPQDLERMVKRNRTPF